MRIIFTDHYESMSEEAAKIIAAQLWLKPDSVLGLATGSTPVMLYQKLIHLYDTVGLDFSQATSFNLDEYVGLSPNDEQSYHRFMHENLFDHVNIRNERIFFPDGLADDAAAEGMRYEKAIEAAGGIDLQLLGIGRNAHIGFNEPADCFTRTTHKVALKGNTIAANARFFASEKDVPREAMSMGIGTIFQARHILLLASGAEKAQAVKDTWEGTITPAVPASILQLHPHVTLIVDREAGSLLTAKGKELA
ncbi:MAG: glucosamine-6-phosphate deaminase [Mitsuokella sp.]